MTDEYQPHLQEIALPSASGLVGRTAKHLVEAVLAPLGIFYGANTFLGL